MLPHDLVMDVYSSWYRIKRIPNYEQVASELIFTKLFEISPISRKIFKFGSQDDYDLKTNPLFLLHATRLIDMISAAVDLLDPNDTDALTHELVELGKRHVKYGVTKEYFPAVATAVDYALTVALGEQTYIDTSLRSHWLATLNFIAEHMTKGMELIQDQMVKDVTASGNLFRVERSSLAQQTVPSTAPAKTNANNLPKVTSSSGMYQQIASVLLYTRLVKLIPPEDVGSSDSFPTSTAVKNVPQQDSSEFQEHFSALNCVSSPHSSYPSSEILGKGEIRRAAKTNALMSDLNQEETKMVHISRNDKQRSHGAHHKTQVYHECSKSMVNAIESAITSLEKKPADIDSVANIFIALGKEYAVKYRIAPKSSDDFIASLEYMMATVLKSSILYRPSYNRSSYHRHVRQQLQESWFYFIGFVMSKLTIGIKQW